jgi:hypothetical protein
VNGCSTVILNFPLASSCWGALPASANGPLHIADPDGGDLMKFEMTYAHIEDAAKGMAQAIRDTLDA